MPDQPTSSLADELSGYIGPATLTEVIAALDDHTPGEWLVEMRDPDDKEVWIKRGWSWYGDDGASPLVVFAIAATEQGAGNPAVYVDAPLVLTFARSGPPLAEFSRYARGVTIALRFGDYAGHTLTLVAWHALLHPTASGDVAPGFDAEVG